MDICVCIIIFFFGENPLKLCFNALLLTFIFVNFLNMLHSVDMCLFTIFNLCFFHSGLLQPSQQPCKRHSAQPDRHQAGQYAALQLWPGLPAYWSEQCHMCQDGPGDFPVECTCASLPRWAGKSLQRIVLIRQIKNQQNLDHFGV